MPDVESYSKFSKMKNALLFKVLVPNTTNSVTKPNLFAAFSTDYFISTTLSTSISTPLSTTSPSIHSTSLLVSISKIPQTTIFQTTLSTPLPTTLSANPHDHTNWISWIIVGLMTLVILTTIAGNILVVVSVFTYKPLRSVQNFYIVSLAFSDFMLALVVMPFHVLYWLLGKWVIGKTLCFVWVTCDVLMCTASILHLCAIAIDRYFAIYDPIRYAQKRTLKRVLLVSFLVWVVSGLISLPPLVPWFDTQKEDGAAAAGGSGQVEMDRWVYEKGGGGGSQVEVDRWMYEEGGSGGGGGSEDGLRDANEALTNQGVNNQIIRNNHRKLGEKNAENSSFSVLKSTSSDLMDVSTTAAKLFLDSETLSNVTDRLTRDGDAKSPYSYRKSLFNSGDLTCRLSNEPHYVVYSALGSFYIPLAIMLFAYVKVYTATKARLRKRAKMGKNLLMNVKKKALNEMEVKGKCGVDGGGVVEDGVVEGGVVGEGLMKENVVEKGVVENSVMERGIKKEGGAERSGVEGRTKGSGNNLSETQQNSCDVESKVEEAVKQKRLSVRSRRKEPYERGLTERKRKKEEVVVRSPFISRFLEEKQRISLSMERRAAQTMAIIMGAFVLCWLPFFVYYILGSFCSCCKHSALLMDLFVWLGYINSTVNPIIYTVFSVDFRRSFKQILQGSCLVNYF